MYVWNVTQMWPRGAPLMVAFCIQGWGCGASTLLLFITSANSLSDSGWEISMPLTRGQNTWHRHTWTARGTVSVQEWEGLSILSSNSLVLLYFRLNKSNFIVFLMIFLAQLVEHRPTNLSQVSSIPGSAIYMPDYLEIKWIYDYSRNTGYVVRPPWYEIISVENCVRRTNEQPNKRTDEPNQINNQTNKTKHTNQHATCLTSPRRCRVPAHVSWSRHRSPHGRPSVGDTRT